MPKPVAEPTTFAGRFFWPLEGTILSRFGPKPAGRYNDGINIKAAAGTPVKAAADGIVAYAGDGIAGFGGLLLLKHGDGWVTAYGHAEELLVARGDKVFVYEIKDGKAELVPVVTGVRESGKVQVISGIQSGTVVVTDGQMKLRPGANAKIVER